MWAVCALGVLCVVFGALLAMGHAMAVRHRAAGAADLAALAAADTWAEGGEGACATAGRVARAQGARIVRCTVEGQIAEVTAASGTAPFTAEVRARAGPPGAAPLDTEPPGTEAPAIEPPPIAPPGTEPPTTEPPTTEPADGVIPATSP